MESDEAENNADEIWDGSCSSPGVDMLSMSPRRVDWGARQVVRMGGTRRSLEGELGAGQPEDGERAGADAGDDEEGQRWRDKKEGERGSVLIRQPIDHIRSGGTGPRKPLAISQSAVRYKSSRQALSLLRLLPPPI